MKSFYRPNYIMVTNTNTNRILYFKLNEFDAIKTSLSNNSVYEHVYISPKTNNIYRTELFNE